MKTRLIGTLLGFSVLALAQGTAAFADDAKKVDTSQPSVVTDKSQPKDEAKTSVLKFPGGKLANGN